MNVTILFDERVAERQSLEFPGRYAYNEGMKYLMSDHAKSQSNIRVMMKSWMPQWVFSGTEVGSVLCSLPNPSAKSHIGRKLLGG